MGLHVTMPQKCEELLWAVSMVGSPRKPAVMQGKEDPLLCIVLVGGSGGSKLDNSDFFTMQESRQQLRRQVQAFVTTCSCKNAKESHKSPLNPY